MAVTIENIAATIGMSKATVSRALRNDRLIHPDTRSMVFKAAAQAGYDRPAKRTKKSERRHSRLLLLLPPDCDKPVNYPLTKYLGGLTRAAAEENCFLAVEEIRKESSGRLSDGAAVPRQIREGQIDAVVVAHSHHPADIESLSKILPVISIQWEYENIPVDMVSAFNYRGTALLTEHLVQFGHQRIGWVGSEQAASFYSDREAGFFNGCIRSGLDPRATEDFQDVYALRERGRLNSSVKAGLTALVCACDIVARNVAVLASECGLRVPEDLSLVGFDAEMENLPNGRQLTSYDPAFSELGRMAVHTAVRRLKDPGAPRMICLQQGRVREGESVTPIVAYC